MKFQNNCEQDFAKAENGDFLCIMAEEKKKKGDIGLPLKYDRLIVKVVDKKKHLLMRFPQELSGNSYNEGSLINKIVGSLEWYETRTLDEKNLFSLMPQNYFIKAITPIKRDVIEKAFKRKKQHLQNKMDQTQKIMDKLESDIKESNILS